MNGQEGSNRLCWYLGCQALEEACETFLLGHVAQDSETALGVLEIAVLNSRLDNVERGRDNERGGSTSDRGNEVLEPASLVVVLEVEEVFLGESGSSEQLVSRSSVSVLSKLG